MIWEEIMDENFNNQQNNQQNNQYNQQNDQYNQQYNQQQYNQPQYNQQQYNQPNNYNNYNNYAPNQYQQPQDNSKGLAIASLVLGIVSFFPCCGSVCSIVSIVLGVLSRKKKPTDNGMATAGIVLSIVALAIWAIYFIYVLVVYGSFSAVYNTGRYY